LTESGEDIPKDISFKLNSLFDEWIKQVPEYIESNRSKIDETTSLGDYLLSKLEEEIRSDEYKEASQTELEQMYGLFAWRLEFKKFQNFQFGC
jgi:hypothetical protein